MSKDKPHNYREPQMLWHDDRKSKELWSRSCKDCDKRQQQYNPEWAIITKSNQEKGTGND